MPTHILSRADAEKLIADGDFPGNAAVVCFHDTNETDFVDYSAVTDRFIYVGIDDLSFDDLNDMNINIDDYFSAADDVAEFIIEAIHDGYDIVCQCEHGESRSAAAAAATDEFLYFGGIDIFTDYRYCPNQVIYNKLYEALIRYSHNPRKKLLLYGFGITPEDREFLINNSFGWEFEFSDNYNEIPYVSADIILINPDFLDDNNRNNILKQFYMPLEYFHEKYLLTKSDILACKLPEIHVINDLSEIFKTEESLPW